MATGRIQVYADDDTKRRIEIAAVKRRTSVTEYCLDAIRERLAEDDVLDADRVTIQVRQDGEGLLADLAALHAAVLARRGGAGVDLDQVLADLREERLDEILGLR
jgi:uncharacterized protein (DUF1778 family)